MIGLNNLKRNKMSKQTAVEWLEEQLKKGVDFNPLDKNSYLNNVEKLFHQAKAMEKENLQDSFIAGGCSRNDFSTGKVFQTYEQYYNETYKETI